MSTAIATTPVTKEETAYKTPRKLNSTKTSTPCVLPILDGKPTADDTAIERYDKTQNESFEGIERDQTFLSSANDFIPIDILNSLTHVPSPPSKDLGPASKHKKLKPIEVKMYNVHMYKKCLCRWMCMCSCKPRISTPIDVN